MISHDPHMTSHDAHITSHNVPPLPLTTEQASADNARAVGLMAEDFANKGWHFAQKQQSKSSHSHNPSGSRAYSTSAHQRDIPISLLMSDVASFPLRLRELRERLLSFMEEHVFPLEATFWEHQTSRHRWTPLPVMEELKVWRINLASQTLCIQQLQSFQHPAYLALQRRKGLTYKTTGECMPLLSTITHHFSLQSHAIPVHSILPPVFIPLPFTSSSFHSTS